MARRKASGSRRGIGAQGARRGDLLSRRIDAEATPNVATKQALPYPPEEESAAAKDSAVVASIALQHGVPVDTIRKALLRDSQGKASSPLGCALDAIAGWGRP